MPTLAHTVAHTVLPTLVFELGPAAVRRLVLRDRSLVWCLPHRVGATPTRRRVEAPRGFGLWTERLGPREVTVIRLPRPEEHGEAHAAVIVPTGPRWTWPWARPRVRYFVLEHRFDAGQDEPSTLIVEWCPGHVRRVWGPGPRASDKAALFVRLQEILSGSVALPREQPRPLAAAAVAALLDAVREQQDRASA